MIKRSHKDARTSLEKLLSTSRAPKDREARRRRQQKIHKRFDEILLEISQLESADVLEPEASTWDEDDFAAHLSTLHAVLSRYSVCIDSSVDIVPKISLSGYRLHDKSGSIFEMLFPDHPHQAEVRPCNWQNAVIHVGPEVYVFSPRQPFFAFCGSNGCVGHSKTKARNNLLTVALNTTSSAEPSVDDNRSSSFSPCRERTASSTSPCTPNLSERLPGC